MNPVPGKPTRWSVVRRAAFGGTAEMLAAREEICQAYWLPVYSWVRQKGQSPETARDLTQGFFEYVIETNWFARADSAKGRLRALMLTSLSHFVVNEYRRQSAKKRGGGQLTVPFTDMEDRRGRLIAPGLPPDLAFQRAWAVGVLEHVMEECRKSYAKRDKLSLFEALRRYLGFEKNEVAEETLAAIARETGRSDATVRTDVARFRSRFGEKLIDHVKHTIGTDDTAEIRTELDELMQSV